MTNLAHYTLLTDEEAYRDAVDEILDKAADQLVIFDHDLALLHLQAPERVAKIETFLRKQPRGNHTKRLRLVIHQTHRLDSHLPRLAALFSHYAHLVDVRQSPANLQHLADTHVLADARHGVRRFHIHHARCALIQENPAAIQPWLGRFEELWTISTPCLRINTTGL